MIRFDRGADGVGEADGGDGDDITCKSAESLGRRLASDGNRAAPLRGGRAGTLEMNELRHTPRKRVLKTGFIVFSDKVPKLECAVRNVSEAGACIQVSTTVGMPASFDLVIDSVRRGCRVVWRTDTRMGIVFT
jgi:hypothetical protein